MAKQGRQRRLDKDTGPAQQEEEDGQPGFGRWQTSYAAHGVQEAALGKREQAGDGLAPGRTQVKPAAARQPGARSAKGDAERLVPPPAPEAGHAAVEDVVDKGAVDGRVVPELGAGAPRDEGGREEQVGDELPRGHDEVDDDGDGGEAAEAVEEG